MSHSLKTSAVLLKPVGILSLAAIVLVVSLETVENFPLAKSPAVLVKEIKRPYCGLGSVTIPALSTLKPVSSNPLGNALPQVNSGNGTVGLVIFK